MTELPVYTEDRIGLKEMNENGQIIFLDTDGDHLAITEDFFADQIVPFLEWAQKQPITCFIPNNFCTISLPIFNHNFKNAVNWFSDVINVAKASTLSIFQAGAV